MIFQWNLFLSPSQIERAVPWQRNDFITSSEVNQCVYWVGLGLGFNEESLIGVWVTLAAVSL